MGLIKWSFTEEPLGELHLKEVENLFGFNLPNDYKECVMENNGGYPKPNIFDGDDGSIETVFNHLISFTDEDLNIKMFYEFSLQKLIPFAKDPFGNLLCFDYRHSETMPKVVFYDDEEAAISLICDSFTDLLERLYSLENI